MKFADMQRMRLHVLDGSGCNFGDILFCILFPLLFFVLGFWIVLYLKQDAAAIYRKPTALFILS